MCGIFGFINSNNKTNFNSINTINNLVNLLSHRGPDFKDTYINKDRSIFLGHTRLSILDLSSNGNQPMISNQGRYVIIYNGEIYNHLDLREELKILNKVTYWKGSSDTETILNCIDIWGIHKTIPKLNGMFSIAIYDIQNENIYLVRDKFGEKPLYYGFVNNSFIFSSELKPIKAFPNFKNQISLDSLSLYFQLNYIPSPKSIYNNIFKLEKGNILSININKLKHNLSNKNYNHNIFDFYKWWDFTLNSNRDFPDNYNYLEKLEKALHNSIKRQLISDVPIGSFLSGGIDSSLVTAIMKEYSNNKINTYTVGFEDKSYDESKYASKIAKYLGTNHNEIILQKNEIINSFSKMNEVYDEPFADSSQIPTHLVCKAARQKVTVALSGDAADELFGGYNRYTWTPRIWKKISWIPFPIRKNLGLFVAAIPTSILDMFGTLLNLMLPKNKKIYRFADKLHKMAARIETSKNLDEFCNSFAQVWSNPDDIIDMSGHLQNYSHHIQPSDFDLEFNDEISKMMYRDLLSYLPDDILCKVDRAAMSVSLETRVPFLDYRVVELSSRIPIDMKIRHAKGKWIIRELLNKYVPEQMIDRPKSGFAIPIGDWIRGPLKGWAEDLLAPEKIISQGYFHSEPIQKIWREHLSGDFDWTPKLWGILMFQSWLEETGIN